MAVYARQSSRIAALPALPAAPADAGAGCAGGPQHLAPRAPAALAAGRLISGPQHFTPRALAALAEVGPARPRPRIGVCKSSPLDRVAPSKPRQPLRRQQTDAAVAKQSQDAKADDIKRAFKANDLDRNGNLSRHEMGLLMKAIGTFSREDVDAVFATMDRNGNGTIECEEFVDWVMQPGSDVDIREGDLVGFDLAAALRPLYQVYDRNGNDSISWDEFERLQTLIHHALQSANINGEITVVADLVGCDIQRVFGIADADGNGAVSFDEFVKWQRDAIEHSGVSCERVVALAQQLATVLTSQLIKPGARRGSTGSNALEEMMQEKLAESAQQLWRRRPRRASCPDLQVSALRAPPPGISVAGLAEAGLSGASAAAGAVELCVPVEGGEGVRWVAKVARRASGRAGRCPEAPVFYAFEGGSWARLPSGSDFHRAVSALPPDLLIFYSLLTKADFRDEPVSWPGVLAALQGCVRQGLLSAEEKLEFELIVGQVLALALGEESGLPAGGEASRRAAEELVPLVELSPTQAMMLLSDCTRISAIWSSASSATERPADERCWRSSLNPAALREKQARTVH